MRALALLVLITACGSAQAPVSRPKPAPRPTARVAEAPEPPPPPEPLAFQDVAFDQKWEFVPAGLGTLSARVMSEAELAKRLPANLRAAYASVERARVAYAKVSGSAYRSKAHRAASDRARKNFLTTLDRVKKTFEKQLDKQATGAVGIALARLAAHSTDSGALAIARWRLVQSAPAWPRLDLDVSYGEIEQDSDAGSVIEPLERAVEVTQLDEIGRWARLELVHYLMSTDRAREAMPILSELLPVTPPDQTPQLHYRIGLLHALDGAHEAAAASFRSAHTELATTSGVTRSTLLYAELLARHRARQFDRVLTLAAEAYSEQLSPAPVKPDPSPPPPPPPPKKGAKRASSIGLLGMLSQGAFGSLDGIASDFGERELFQLATDAVERLNLAPDKLAGPPALKASILSRLATRSLYRNDLERAKSLASAARDLDHPASLDGIRVLRVLADRAGDAGAVAELDRKIQALAYRTPRGYGPEHDFLLAETRRKSKQDRTDPKTNPSKRPPDVERNVRSLVRLCLEPIHQQFSQARDGDGVVAEMELEAKVFADGRAELSDAEAPAGALAELRRCTESLAPRVFAHAPSSVRARVTLESLRAPRGRLFGDMIGDAFGSYGSLGGSGLGDGSYASGATGLGGLGELGRRGSGGATGGGIGRIGTGSAGGRLPKKKPAQPPKKQP